MSGVRRACPVGARGRGGEGEGGRRGGGCRFESVESLNVNVCVYVFYMKARLTSDEALDAIVAVTRTAAAALFGVYDDGDDGDDDDDDDYQRATISE